jgi:hypothetical protein
MQRMIVKNATMTVEAANPDVGVMAADNDACVVDVSDMSHISIYLNQLVDDGNATLTVTKSVDGVNFAPVASKTQGDFAAGVNKAVELTLSDGNGMPTSARTLQCVLTGSSGNGTYTMTVAGSKRSFR